ncbi:MAG TPA: peptide transporter [Phycisphaerae bacterium]|nr:peptide transporter [Phycisphaerae bacterium]
MNEDRELREYRLLLEPPATFADGFSARSVLGCIFIGLVMMPASMYLSLLAGADLTGAARWVTVILFVELARRSFTTLKQPEIFILFYMAGAAVSSPFSGLLWNQYYATSDPAITHGIAEHIPRWVAPSADVIARRSFFRMEWLGPIGMIALGQLLGRLDNFGLGYILFRVTSDVEKLPFPMAPVGALGITALAESSATRAGGGDGAGKPAETTWRWRVFSIGGMIGLAFGALYIGIPALSGTFLKTPIQILPITFTDLTTSTQNILPATPVTLSFDVGNLLVGMVLPFYAILGTFLGMILTWIANPILHATGQLPSWQPGMNAVDTAFANHVDVYLSVGIGLALAIAAIGFYHVFSGLRESKKNREANNAIENQKSRIENAPTNDSPWHRLLHPPAGRGDIPLIVAVGIYFFSTTTYIVLSHWLVPNFPLWILLGYGFIYTPVISYVAARMEGVAGQWVEIPMVREATFIAAQSLGYKGVDIWFAPIPLNNYAGNVVNFRTQELTGTKFTSIIKAEFVIFPVVIVSSILFSQYLWRIAPIPSAIYPYANQLWELQARQQALLQSSTLGNAGGGGISFYEAIKWKYIAGSAGTGILLYSALSFAGAPVMLCYGLVRGLGTGLAAGVIPQMIGALLGRYYFEKRLGLKWRQYAPVLLAGFSCGVGLISMFSLGCLLISKAVFQLPY